MRKLNGYRPTHKNKWLFIKHKILTVQELSLLEFYADIFDFDKDHQAYGTFTVDFPEVAEIFCKSQNTIRNWHNKLLRLGFVIKTKKRYTYQLACFERYINPGWQGGKASDYVGLETNQPIEVILQNFGINFQPNGENPQPIVKKIDNLALESNAKALGSYKDESRVYQSRSSGKKQAITSEEEYQHVLSRVDELGELIGEDWSSNNPQIKLLVNEHQELANQMLLYQIEHDLLPI